MQLGSILVGDREAVIVNTNNGRTAALREFYATTDLGTGPHSIQAFIEIERLSRLANPAVRTRAAR